MLFGGGGCYLEHFDQPSSRLVHGGSYEMLIVWSDPNCFPSNPKIPPNPCELTGIEWEEYYGVSRWQKDCWLPPSQPLRWNPNPNPPRVRDASTLFLVLIIGADQFCSVENSRPHKGIRE